MDYETIAYEVVEEGIGVLSLNRPRLFNPVNPRRMGELEDFWRARQFDLATKYF
jgi:1,4-dihydroxy-2-naphthoyl-CoA synthase